MILFTIIKNSSIWHWRNADGRRSICLPYVQYNDLYNLCVTVTVATVDIASTIKTQVAEVLSNSGPAKRGRPSQTVQTQIDYKRVKPTASDYPIQQLRTDQISYWPEWTPARNRCKLPGCTSLSSVKCCKCGLNLCFNKDRNCCTTFHN